MNFSANFKNILVGFLPFLLAELNHTPVAILSVFLIFDVLTGVMATVRVDGVRKLSSRTFSFGILYKFFVLLIPMIVVWTGKGIGLDLLMFAIWALNLLIVSEALSILGNIYTIKTGKYSEEVDVVNMIIKKMKEMLMSFLERSSKS